jgi:nickel transport protein
MNRCQALAIIVIILVICFLPVSTVLAHKMVIEEIGEGAVKVGYEDGRFSRRTVVVVYDQQGTEITRGELDDDGIFYYPSEQAVLIEADDGLGHRAELALGQESHEEPPRGLTVAAVFSGFVFIAGVFQFRIYKKRNNEEELN